MSTINANILLHTHMFVRPIPILLYPSFIHSTIHRFCTSHILFKLHSRTTMFFFVSTPYASVKQNSDCVFTSTSTYTEIIVVRVRCSYHNKLQLAIEEKKIYTHKCLNNCIIKQVYCFQAFISIHCDILSS